MDGDTDVDAASQCLSACGLNSVRFAVSYYVPRFRAAVTGCTSDICLAILKRFIAKNFIFVLLSADNG